MQVMNLIYVEKLEYLRKQLANKAELPSYVLLNDIVHFGATVVNRMRLEKYNNLGGKKLWENHCLIY